MQKMGQGDLKKKKTKKALYKYKQMDRTLISIYVGVLRVGHTTKTNCIKFGTVDPEIYFFIILIF